MKIKTVFEIFARPCIDSFYFRGISSRRHVGGETQHLAGCRCCQPSVGNPSRTLWHRKVKRKVFPTQVHLFRWLLYRM